MVLGILGSAFLFADLSHFVTGDPRLNPGAIPRAYDQIEGYSAKAQAWEREFLSTHGPDWEILIDLRGGRPARIHGPGIPVLPGVGSGSGTRCICCRRPAPTHRRGRQTEAYNGRTRVRPLGSWAPEPVW